jgi:hypothetical protein
MRAIHPAIRRQALLIGIAFAVPAIHAASGDVPVPTDAFPDFESYIKVSGEAPWITGDPAAFANRTGTPSTGSGGIEDLFYTKDLSDTTTLTINGRALAGVDDYLASVNIEKDKFGSFDAGYSRFRTFYDGVGGFFPLSDSFYRLDPEELHVDRSKVWVNLKLALPDRPVFTLSFRNETRTGMKDSTGWAVVINPEAVIVHGKLVGTTAPSNTPELDPNAMTMDEHHNILEGGMTATVGKTTEILKATLDTVNNSDGRAYVKYPDSTVIADPTVVVQDDDETRKATSFRILSQTETKLSDQVALEVGLTYNHISSTDGGFWITPAYNATANVIFDAETAADIYGISRVDDYVGNAALSYTPTKDWQIRMAYRDEYDVTASDGSFTTTSLATTAKSIASKYITTSDDLTYSHYLERIETPEFSLQYTGVRNLTLYGSIDKRTNEGDQHWINPYAAMVNAGGVVSESGAPIGNVFFQDGNQDNWNAKAGFNWNASSFLTVRAEIYRKDDQNQFVGANIAGTGSFGGFYATGLTFTGMKFNVVLKPLPNLTLTTRYQPQSGMMSTNGNAVNGGQGNEITSGKVDGQMISETLNWSPTQSVYFQANINIVYDYIQTAYPAVVVSTTSYVPPPIQNANNNYITSSALCGFALNKTTDVQFQVAWSQATNYNPQIATGGEPYGASFLDESATAGLKHKFNPRLLGEFKGGYLRRTDDTTGGFTNYRGPLIYAAVTYSL